MPTTPPSHRHRATSSGARHRIGRTPDAGPKHAKVSGARVPIVLAMALVAGTVAVNAAIDTSGAAAAPKTWVATTEVAKDSYGRVVTSGLGIADRGGAYTVTASKGVASRVANDAARIDALAPGNYWHTQLRATRDQDALVQVALTGPTTASNAAGLYYAVDLRAQQDGSMYRAKIKISKNLLGLRLSRVGPGLDAGLATRELGVAVQPGQKVILQAQATGASDPSIATRAWVEGA